MEETTYWVTGELQSFRSKSRLFPLVLLNYMGQLESASMNFRHNNTTLNMYTTKLLEHVIGKTYNTQRYVCTSQNCSKLSLNEVIFDLFDVNMMVLSLNTVVCETFCALARDVIYTYFTCHHDIHLLGRKVKVYSVIDIQTNDMSQVQVILYKIDAVFFQLKPKVDYRLSFK